MTILRWIAVPLVAALAWYATFIMGFFMAMMVPCPEDAIVSGGCTARWHNNAIDVLQVAFSALSAFLVVISAAWAAPARKTQVAWLAYVGGCAFAVYGVLQVGASVHFLTAFLSAIASGLFAQRLVTKVHGRMKPAQQSVQPDRREHAAPD
jgi:hypothetical protein